MLLQTSGVPARTHACACPRSTRRGRLWHGTSSDVSEDDTDPRVPRGLFPSRLGGSVVRTHLADGRRSLLVTFGSFRFLRSGYCCAGDSVRMCKCICAIESCTRTRCHQRGCHQRGCSFRSDRCRQIPLSPRKVIPIYVPTLRKTVSLLSCSTQYI